MSLLGPRARASGGDTRRVRAWAEEVFAVPAEGSVVVTQLACSEPGCPPLETAIAIATAPGEPPRVHNIHKPVADVTRDDLERLRQGGPTQ